MANSKGFTVAELAAREWSKEEDARKKRTTKEIKDEDIRLPTSHRRHQHTRRRRSYSGYSEDEKDRLRGRVRVKNYVKPPSDAIFKMESSSSESSSFTSSYKDESERRSRRRKREAYSREDLRRNEHKHEDVYRRRSKLSERGEYASGYRKRASSSEDTADNGERFGLSKYARRRRSSRSRQRGEETRRKAETSRSWLHDKFVNRSPSPNRERTDGEHWNTRKGSWISRAGGMYLPPKEGPTDSSDIPLQPEAARYKFPLNVREKRDNSSVKSNRRGRRFSGETSSRSTSSSRFRETRDSPVYELD